MRKIGKYTICGMLGRGGMSKVYKVKLPVIGKLAALKVLDPDPLLIDLIGVEKVKELFISEAVTMANLRHPNIVGIGTFDGSDGKLSYLMDYYCNNLGVMIGESYRTDESSRVISVDKAIHYTRQTLEGLACLHHAGIIHRDIKPYNILITDQDIAKICDFGLSKKRGESFEGPSNLNVGSPWYAAPEQEEKPDDVDFSADIYSVGVMLYRMLTGILPGDGDSEAEVELPSIMNPDLDDLWDEFLIQALSQDRRKRFQNARHMLDRLMELQSAWEERKEKICILPEHAHADSNRSIPSSPVRLRKQSIKISPRKAEETFGIDRLWRPQEYVQNDFRKDENQTITDLTTDLVWQSGGSEYPLTWDRATSYVERLNRSRFGGRDNWRLPTVEELMSILSPAPHGTDFCMAPVFDQQQKWLWSCDKRSFLAGWYVNVELGFVSWQDFSCFYYAKAVSDR